jgi:hypothetical protein
MSGFIAMIPHEPCTRPPGSSLRACAWRRTDPRSDKWNLQRVAQTRPTATRTGSRKIITNLRDFFLRKHVGDDGESVVRDNLWQLQIATSHAGFHTAFHE